MKNFVINGSVRLVKIKIHQKIGFGRNREKTQVE